jgi:hypothetical protein
MVSPLAMLELDEMMARYASYENLMEIIRHPTGYPAVKDDTAIRIGAIDAAK